LGYTLSTGNRVESLKIRAVRDDLGSRAGETGLLAASLTGAG